MTPVLINAPVSKRTEPLDMTRWLLITFAIASVVFWVAMIVDAVTNKGVSDTERLMWVLLVVLLTPAVPLGAMIYFLYGRPKRRLGT